MASVRVRIDDFEDGVYPDVCASSGVVGGARLYRADATHRPGWVWLLVFLGPLGFVGAIVLSIALQKSAPGFVPYTEATQAQLGRRRRRFAEGAAASLAVLVGSLALSVSSQGGSGFSGLAALGFVVGGIGLVVCGFLWCNLPGSVGTKLESNGRWVLLSPVSHAFAAGYDGQERRRRAARRADSDTPVRAVW